MSKGGGGGSQTQRVEPPKFIKPHLGEAAQASSDLFQQGPQQFFPGQTYAPLDPLQLAGMGQQLGYAQGALPGMIGDINQSFGSALTAGDIFRDPSVQAGLGTIESRANQNFLENVLPGLRRGATAAGQEFGTRGELAAGVAGSRLQRDIGDAQAQFLANQLGSARQLQGVGLSQAPVMTQLGLMPGQITGQIGDVFQQQTGQQIAEDIARHDFGQQAQQNLLGQYISNITPLAGFGSTVTQSGGGISPLAGALGGGLLGNQLAGSSFVTGGMTPLSGALSGLGGMFGGFGLPVAGAILGGLLS